MAAAPLTADQVELAKAIYEHFHAHGGWLTIPDLEYAEFKKRSTVDVNEALRAFPPRLGGYDSNNSFALSPRGILAAVGNVDETGDFIVALRMLVDRYDEQGPAATLAAQELVASGMSPARAARVFPLMQRESRIWRTLSGSSISDWKITVDPQVRHFLDIRDIADYDERCRKLELAQSVPSQVFDQLVGVRQEVTGIVSSSTGAAESVEQLSTDLQTLAERLEGQVRKDIEKAADEARVAAEQGRGAVQAVNVLQTKLSTLQESIRDAGIDRFGIEIAELRRLLHDHIDRHG